MIISIWKNKLNARRVLVYRPVYDGRLPCPSNSWTPTVSIWSAWETETAPGSVARESATNSPCDSWALRAVWTVDAADCSTDCSSCSVASSTCPPRVAAVKQSLYRYSRKTGRGACLGCQLCCHCSSRNAPVDRFLAEDYDQGCEYTKKTTKYAH